MYQYLAKYFALHKKMLLPGIGSFSAEIKPAQLAFVDKTLYAPAHTITFRQDENATDNYFKSFLIKETGWSEQDVAARFNQFIEELKAKLHSGISLHIPGIGMLTSKDESYAFIAESLEPFFPIVIADRVIRQNAQHNVRVGEDQKTSTEMHKMLSKEAVQDRWWIAAVVLGAVGVAAILYYYLS